METAQKSSKAYQLSLPRRVGYGVGDFGINMFSTVVGSFLTAYYTDSVLLAAVFVGNMMLFTRILDGVSDLVMGAVIDNTYTKWGKARPWLALAVVPFCLSFFLVFNVPAGLGDTAAKVYVVLTYIFHTVVCSTIANVALSTLAVKITSDGPTRSSAVSIRIMFSNLAIFVGNTYTASIVMFFGGNQQGYFGMSILYSVITAICLVITCVSSKELLVESKQQEQERMAASGIQQQKGGVQAILTALFSNHYVLPMAIAFAFNWLALSINGGGQVYYCRDVLGSMRYMSTLSMARSIPAIVILLVGFAPIYIGKLGKKVAIVAGCALQIISCVIMWVAPMSVTALVIGNILKGVFQGLVNTVLFATVADISDYVDLKNNVSIADINLLFAWIMEHGGEYNMDINNLFIVSDSSGAQITSQYAALLTNPEFQKCFPFTPPQGLTVRAVALNCGVYDAKGYILGDPDAPIHYYVGELTEEKLEAMNTMKYVTSAFPPAYIISANRDFLLKNAQPMYEALQALGVPSKVQIFGTEERPLGHVFHLDIRCPEAVECSDNECAFFREYIIEK